MACLPLQVGLSVVHEVSFITMSTLYHLASRVPALKKYKLQPKQETSTSQIMVGGHVGMCSMEWLGDKVTFEIIQAARLT